MFGEPLPLSVDPSADAAFPILSKTSPVAPIRVPAPNNTPSGFLDFLTFSNSPVPINPAPTAWDAYPISSKTFPVFTTLLFLSCVSPVSGFS